VIQHREILGTRLHVVDYIAAVNQILEWTRCEGVFCVAAANTHLLGEAATCASFASVLNSFDLVVPDGMPLVWALRLEGAVMEDRVYGPYLMQRVLAESVTYGTRHFFLGGTEDTLSQLRRSVEAEHVGVNVVGTLSPPFGEWDAATEHSIVSAIEEAKADCVWVALGGVKQERWIHHIKPQLGKAVLLAVGDAFVLNAGLRRFAPRWMQRCGMTWLWRLLQEPKRLAGRYATYHWRFLKAYLAERWSWCWR
jgi:N-acetylglucosaminyldiphosphoundecaprenol N-acetyl-beta-D-mannosaminyltransferase